MSRVIKFRAWDEQAKAMHQDFRFIKSGDDGNDWVIFTSDLQTLQEKHHPFENPYFQQQFKIMQFTGLLDANGVEIYESDVIKGLLVDKRGERFEFTGSVFYQEYEFCVETDLHSWPVAAWHCVEKPVVIGNSYQNPELLK
jgi:uncharacterized phage protein (TIGR01671 family)